MKRPGYLLLEILCAVALMSVLLGVVIVRFGDGNKRLQEQQLNMAARRFITECRRVQQYNMYAKFGNRLGITYGIGNNYFLIEETGQPAEKYKFADEGCGDIVFASEGEIYLSPLGSVDASDYITLKHRDNPELNLILNLQPVTGRLEVDE